MLELAAVVDGMHGRAYSMDRAALCFHRFFHAYPLPS